jgi:hypothetical protein
MIKTRNIASFVDEIKDFKDRGKKEIIQETKQRNTAAMRTMVNVAPVWTGNYLSNFHVLIGNQVLPTEQVVQEKAIIGSEGGVPLKLDEAAENALRTRMKLQTNILKAYNKLGRVRIVNVCNYAKGVEYGIYPAKLPYMVFQNGWNRLIFK